MSEEVDVAKKDQKGPVIICVDTSGSMQREFLVENSVSERSERRTPENIAKTVTFALSKIAMEISTKEWNAYIESMKNAISEDKASPAF